MLYTDWSDSQRWIHSQNQRVDDNSVLFARRQGDVANAYMLSKGCAYLISLLIRTVFIPAKRKRAVDLRQGLLGQRTECKH